MSRKIISIIILVAVILFNFNCYTSKELSHSKTLKKIRRSEKSIEMVEIKTKTGGIFKFPMDNPASFDRDTVDTIGIDKDKYVTAIKDTIVGTTIDSIQVSIPTSDVDQVKIKTLHPAIKVGIVAFVGTPVWIAAFFGVLAIALRNFD